MTCLNVRLHLLFVKRLICSKMLYTQACKIFEVNFGRTIRRRWPVGALSTLRAAPRGDSGTVRWNNADSNTAGYSRYKDDPLHVLEASIDLLELGRRIRCAREINGRSQEAFADVCRLDRSYFLEIKRGESNLTFNILSQICSGLNCDLASLTKGIPQIVAAPQKTQVVSGLPTTRRGPMFSRRFCEKRPRDRSHEIWRSFPLS